ncbi:chemotaxis protein CheA [Marivivens donghaensis]|jgi:two-component system, chemotaxis family, sensor kinase CheA|uniref:chemotaxis protein CheA n=1 Tax=Marivivens donghaensis TaxID=1699413 RepID=UPI003F69549C
MSDDLIAVFQEELAELLESLERGLVDLQESPEDAGLINQVFRDLHTVKGSGAMFGFTDLAAFIHDFETAFEKVRAGAVAVTPELVRLGLAARDQIPGLVNGDADPDGDRVAILNALRDLTSGGGVAAADIDDEIEAEAVTLNAPATLRFKLSEDALALGARPDILLSELKDLGATQIVADLSDIPALDDLNADQCYVAWQMQLPAGVAEGDVEDVFMFADADWTLTATEVNEVVERDEIDDLLSEAAALDTPAPQQQAPSEKAPAATEPAASIRVPAARLDALMDSVGELVTVEARLTELARHSRDPALLSTAEEVTRLAARLRDATMTMRMVPMRTLVSRFRRLILGLSSDLGKPVEFVVDGEDTELDKTVIEKLADPLVHILRNAIDHGMEDPAARAQTDKDQVGRIELSATHVGGEVHIVVRDDGRGMSADKIRAKAIERGLITSEAQLTAGQVFALVLEPGFSTAETITELSGRGVGMDVVRRTIEGLRGVIEIDSKLGQGTTVTLRLPLTLAIIDGLLIEIADERYTLPMSSVKEIFELPLDKRSASRNGDYLDIRGQFVPFVRLRHLFDCEGEPPTEQNVVVVESGDARMGVVVDRIIGTNQTVIKQVSKLQQGARAISGATILGDGTVSLIVDVAQLLAMSGPLIEPKKEVAA